LNCAQVADELLAARRGESERQSEVYAHLNDCPKCRELADRMGRSLALLDSAGDFEPSERPWDGIRRALASEGAIPPKRLTRGRFDLHKRLPSTFKYVAAVVAAAAAVALLVHSRTPWKERQVVASAGTSGTIHVSLASEGSWELLPPGGLLRSGDRVATTRRGAGQMRLSSGVSVDLNSGTVLELFDPSYLYMHTGEVYVVARPGTGFTVQTESAKVRVTGTRFTVLAERGSTRVTVVEGSVEIRNAKGHVTVSAGQAASVDKGKAPRAPVATDPAKAIGWTLEPEPKISLALSGSRVRQGSKLTAEVTVVNPKAEPMSIYAPGGVQPFYMFRITGPRRGSSWVQQASPVRSASTAREPQAATISIDPGSRHSFKCSLPKLTAAPGEYTVSAIYYAYRAEDAPEWLWTGTIESSPVKVEVTEAR